MTKKKNKNRIPLHLIVVRCHLQLIKIYSSTFPHISEGEARKASMSPLQKIWMYGYVSKKMILLKVKVLIQILYLSKRMKVQIQKCT